MDDLALQSRRSFLEEAEKLLENGNDRAALALAGARLERLPGDPDARMVMCRAQILQGRPDEAGQTLHEMEDFLTGLSRIYRELGDLSLEKGMPESARTYYRKFISLNPDTPEALEIAERFRGIPEPRGSDDGAEAEETNRVPDDFQTVTLADLYIRQGHLQLAREVLEAVLRKDPQQEEAAKRLWEITETPGGKATAAKETQVLSELARWLDNIGRLRGNAA